MDATWLILILAGLASALFIGNKVRKSFKNGDCGSCCGSCSKDCKKKLS